MTALTLYPIVKTATTTLTTASIVASSAGGTNTTSDTTKIDTSTGWGEIYSLGNAGAWAAGGAIGSPSGNGWLWDVTTLEGQTIAAGNWTPTLELATSNGSINLTLNWRAYIRSSGGVYTLINTFSLTSQTMNGSFASYAFSAVSLAAQSLSTGNKLYFDCWANITSNFASAGATIKFKAPTGVSGGNTVCQTITPGYAPTIGTAHVLICDGYGGVFS